MKKGKNYLIMITLAVIVFGAGCSKEDPPGENISTGELQITAEMAGISSNVSTRSVENGTGFTDGSTIGIFISGTGYPSTDVTYTANGGSWIITGDTIYLTEDTAMVYGYYPTEEPSASSPVKATKEDKVIIPVTIRNPETFGATEQADYMYALATVENRIPSALATVDKENNTASLVFIHALAELTFSVKLADDFEGSGSVTDIKLTRSGEYFSWGTGTMSLEASPESRFDSLNTTKELTFSGVQALSATASEISVLVVPAIAENITITLYLVINGTLSMVTGILPTGSGDSTFSEWEAGNNYRYTVTVSGGELSLESEINAWNNISAGEVSVE
ncbi:MAG: fimbrillin family protein [Mangrovibacterium sp.]